MRTSACDLRHRNPMRGLLLKPSGVGTGWISARDPRAHVCQDVVASGACSSRCTSCRTHTIGARWRHHAEDLVVHLVTRPRNLLAAFSDETPSVVLKGRGVCGFSSGVGNRLRLARRRTSTANARRRVCDHVTAGVPFSAPAVACVDENADRRWSRRTKVGPSNVKSESAGASDRSRPRWQVPSHAWCDHEPAALQRSASARARGRVELCPRPSVADDERWGEARSLVLTPKPAKLLALIIREMSAGRSLSSPSAFLCPCSA